MPIEEDPEKINDADRQMQARLYEQAQDYAETRVESKDLNKRRADSRKKVSDMGFRTDAYQTGIRIVKDLSTRERADFMRDLNLIVKVLGKRQAELFPEEALKIAKREEAKKAENKPKSRAAVDATSDANPRSNPKAGGAGKKRTVAQRVADNAEKVAGAMPGAEPGGVVGDGVDGDALIRDVAERTAAELAEQEAGSKVIAEATPLSQSAQAAQALAKAGLQ